MINRALNLKGHILLSAVAALAVCAPLYTRADERIVISHRTVSYADLDLNTADGARVLYARLKGASRSVCAPLETTTLSLTNDYKTCVQDALGHGVHDVNRASLVQLYLGDHSDRVAASYSIERTVRYASR